MKICHHLLTLMSFQTCVSLFLMLNIKEDILKNAGNQTVDGVFPTSIVEKEILWKSMGTKNCLVLQNILFCVQHKKETYTGLE